MASYYLTAQTCFEQDFSRIWPQATRPLNEVLTGSDRVDNHDPDKLCLGPKEAILELRLTAEESGDPVLLRYTRAISEDWRRTKGSTYTYIDRVCPPM